MYNIKCSKCNRLYKLEHYRDIAWYYKINFKTNLFKLETLKDELYLYIFKCVNYKDDY